MSGRAKHSELVDTFVKTFDDKDGDGSSVSVASEEISKLKEFNLSMQRELFLLGRHNQSLNKKFDVVQGHNVMLAKERDSVVSETSSLQAKNDRLKSLSEELTRLEAEAREEVNKAISTDNRPSLSEEFSGTLQSITERLDKHASVRVLLAEENAALKVDLRACLGSHDEAEKSFNMQMSNLDTAIQKATLHAVAQEKRGKSLKEKTDKYVVDIKKLTDEEAAMKVQLSHYAVKFEEFQTELNKSNDVFNSYKVRMDQLSGVIAQSEQEKSGLATEYSKSLVKIKVLENEERTMMQDIEKLSKQVKSLTGLCDVWHSKKVDLCVSMSSEATKDKADQ